MALKFQNAQNEHKVDYRPATDLPAGSLVSLGAKKCYTSIDLAAGELGSVNWPYGGAQVEVSNGNNLAGSAGDEIDYDGTDALAAAGFGFAAADFVATDSFIKVVHHQ